MNLEQLNHFMQQKHMRGYWAREEAPAYEPASALSPFVWKWTDVREVVELAAKYVDTSMAFRRNISLVNPSGNPKTITMGLQVVLPGEKVKAHRHTAEAIRFVIQGNARAWSTVDGEALIMEAGDLILTPNWTWHDHANESSEPVIWIDGLNAALMGHLQLAFREDYPRPQQPVEAPPDYNRRIASVTRPTWLEGEAALPGTPYRYPWTETETTLNALRGSDADPCDGVMLRYANPWSGGPTLPFFSCSIQLLRPGLKTKSHRHTSISSYHVVRGKGLTRAGETDLKWEDRDFFVVPPWAWHHHENLGSEDAILFSMSDWPFLKPFGLYREETEGEEVSRDRRGWFRTA